MTADEQQAGQRGTRPAEGNRVDCRIEAQLQLCATLHVEAHDIAAPGPRGGPQFPVGRKRQVIDPRVAEVSEGKRRRVENLDTVARGHIDPSARRIDRERLGQTLAVTAEYREARGIELQQLAATGARPEPTIEVVDHVVDRLVEHDERVQRTTTELAEAIERATVRTTADDHAAIGLHQDRQGSDTGMALPDAGREHFRRERRKHLAELRGPGRGCGRYPLLRLQEQHIGRRRFAGRGRNVRVLRGTPHIGERTQVHLRAVVRQRRDRDRTLLVACIVGGDRDEFVAVPGLALEHRERIGALAQPDLPVPAILRHIDRRVPDA